MANDPAFFGAFIDGGATHRAFGVRLRPFCAWHLLLLQAVESPFLMGASVTLFDVKTAIGICRLRFGDSVIRRPRFPWFIRRKRLEKIVHEVLLPYMGDFLQQPEFALDIEPSRAGKSSRGAPPEPLRIACGAMEMLGCDERSAWEMPLGRARWYGLMGNYFKGSPLDFVTARERQFQEDMKKAGIKSWNPTQQKKGLPT